MVIWNLIIVNNNHLVFKKEKPVGPTNFICFCMIYSQSEDRHVKATELIVIFICC